MKISFTLNITGVTDSDGEEIPTTEEHYPLAAEQFKGDYAYAEHELVLEDGTIISFEMEDVEVVK